MKGLQTRKYSLAGNSWFLFEEGLAPVLEHYSHPGDERRHYATYEFRGRKIFVKSFLEVGFSGFLRRTFYSRGKLEFTVGARLSDMGISTPEVYGHGRGHNMTAVVEEYVDGPSLLYEMKRNADHEHLLARLADFLRELSSKHVRHNDLHLDNILIKDNRFYIIDLHKTQIKKSFNEKDEISNVTHALGMIYDDIRNDELEIFFDRYACSRTMRGKIEGRIIALKRQWVLSKKKRAFRSTSLLNVSSDYVYIRGSETEANGEFVAFLKKDRKTSVELYSDHVRKIYRHAHRLRKAWANHVVLAYLGIQAAPTAYFVKLPKSSPGYVAMEDLGHKGLELDRFLDGRYDSMSHGDRIRFVNGFASFLQLLFRKRVFHGDMKGCNVFVLNDSHFVLLDVEDFVFCQVGADELVKALVQLNTTIPKRISTRIRMRFFLKLVSSFNVEGKRVFREILKESLAQNIVYEGTTGLKIENW